MHVYESRSPLRLFFISDVFFFQKSCKRLTFSRDLTFVFFLPFFAVKSMLDTCMLSSVKAEVKTLFFSSCDFQEKCLKLLRSNLIDFLLLKECMIHACYQVSRAK